MRPINIKMSAFGSYAAEETIDFTDINSGIFLITGDTGAGKTTIFDAITYALYDETSGGKRNGEMMRSQYADDDTSTFVEYRFTYNNKNYTIIRSPKQKRISKRKNKDGEYNLTIEQPSVTLIMPDGQPFKGKLRETNQKIIDIIGLDVNQFTQIAMIAQGDFLKLLHASSKERKEIFAKIFNTRIYWQIEEELKNRAKVIYGELEDNRKSIIRELEDVSYIKDSEFVLRWEEMADFMETDTDKQLELISQIIEEAKNKEQEIIKSISKNDEELDAINTKTKQAEDINKLFTLLELTHNKKEELNNQKKEMETIKCQIDFAKKAQQVEPKEIAYIAKYKDLSDCKGRINNIKTWIEENQNKLHELKNEKEQKDEEYKKENPKYNIKISNINELLPKYELLDSKTANKEQLQESEKRVGEKLKAVRDNIVEAKNRKQKIAGEQEELKVISDKYVDIKHKVQRLSERKDDLEGLLKSIDLMKALKSKYQEEIKDYKDVDVNYELQRKHYEETYHSFIEGQAGILAATLEDDSPCPVCGSTTHPHRAVNVDQLIDESNLKTAKAQMDLAQKAKQDKYDSMQKAKQEYENERDLATHEGRRIIDRSYSPEGMADIDVLSILDGCKRQLKDETYDRDQAKQASDKYTANENLLKSLDENIGDYESSKEETDRALQEVAVSLAETSTSIISLKEALVYQSKSHAYKELSETKIKLQDLEQSKQGITKKYQELADLTVEKQGNLKSEEGSLSRLTKETKEAEEVFYNEIKLQGFIDSDSYKKALLGSERIDQLDALYQSYRDEITKNETNIENYTEQTKGKARIQTTELEEKKAELVKIKDELEKKSKNVYGIRIRNESVFAKVTKLISLREKSKLEYGIISRLANTANGKLSQRHLNFQTYIQRRYFNSILHEANKRLYTMSNNQFILKCRDMEDLSGQGEVGLDLDVYSMVNDQVRDVKTLSGGESFMAALSMALGMSDIIQNTAGKIHIDTMFIDEGFGSLSDDTRAQAIKILNDLSEGKRLVGIISHVTELKAQIGTKLVITKGDKGSKARWEIS